MSLQRLTSVFPTDGGPRAYAAGAVVDHQSFWRAVTVDDGDDKHGRLIGEGCSHGPTHRATVTVKDWKGRRYLAGFDPFGERAEKWLRDGWEMSALKPRPVFSVVGGGR